MQTLNAGILNYNPTTDLKVTAIPDTVHVVAKNNLDNGATMQSGSIEVSSSIYNSAAVLPSSNTVTVAYSNDNIATVGVGSFSASNTVTTAQYTASRSAVGSTVATVMVRDVRHRQPYIDPLPL